MRHFDCRCQRSGCPINLTLETLGDRWSLIVIRDIMFGNRRHFRELLTQSEEGIASNILADRLKRLDGSGLLTRADDPSHKQKAIYSLTEPAIQLVPLLAAIGAWGRRHLPTTPELAIRAQLLEEGGPALWERSWPNCATRISARRCPNGTTRSCRASPQRTKRSPTPDDGGRIVPIAALLPRADEPRATEN